MNKRQLKQSAMDDFMRSLDQLNDLLGNDSGSDTWDEESLNTGSTNVADIPSSTTAPEQPASVPTKAQPEH